MKSYFVGVREILLIMLVGFGFMTVTSILLTPSSFEGVHVQRRYSQPKEEDEYRIKRGGTREEMSGSSLPDCSHACEACSPCKRVIVGFKCSLAESCPVVYRCRCNGKYYHVPSN